MPFSMVFLWRIRRIPRRRVLLYFVLFFISTLYVLIASSPTADEFFMSPQWGVAIEFPNTRTNISNVDSAVGFQLSNLFGYVTSKGIITHVDSVPFDVSYSATRFINYQRDNSEMIIRDIYGTPLQTIKVRGYPRLLDERVVSLAANGDTIMEWDKLGGLRWQREHHTIISDVALQGNHTLIGLLDGRAVLINKNGILNYEYQEPRAKNPMIIGVALSSDRRFSALASGVDPTHLVVLENKFENPREIAHIILPHTRYQLQPLHFLSDNSSVIFERNNTLYHFDVNTVNLQELQNDVRLLDISHSSCCVAFITSSTTLQAHSGITLQILHVELGSIIKVTLPPSRNSQPYFVHITDGPPPALFIGFERALYYIEMV